MKAAVFYIGGIDVYIQEDAKTAVPVATMMSSLVTDEFNDTSLVNLLDISLVGDDGDGIKISTESKTSKGRTLLIADLHNRIKVDAPFVPIPLDLVSLAGLASERVYRRYFDVFQKIYITSVP